MVNLSTDLKDERRPEIPQCWLQEPPRVDNAQGRSDGWTAYWEHLGGTRQFFREQAKEYVRNLESAIVLDPSQRVLDFGCGFGFVAELLASKVGQVFLWDASANMRRHARLNVAYHQNIHFLDLSDPQTAGPEVTFDLILVNSVVQYMPADGFCACLELWRNMLSAGGRVIVSDLIPPDYNWFADIFDILKFSLRCGILGSAILQSFRDLGRYWRVRQSYPLTRVDPEQLRRWGTAAGLTVSCLPCNLTYFTRRYTAVFTDADRN